MKSLVGCVGGTNAFLRAIGCLLINIELTSEFPGRASFVLAQSALSR